MRAAGVVVRVVRVGLPRRGFVDVGPFEIRRGDGAWNALHHELFRSIGHHRSNRMPSRIVEDRHLPPALIVGWLAVRPSLRTERLVPPDHASLVVVRLPTGDDDVGAGGIGVRSSDDIGCGRGPSALRVGKHRVSAAETRIAELHVVILAPRLKEPAESVGVLDRGDDLVTLRQRHASGVVMHLSCRADGDRLTLRGRTAIERLEVVFETVARTGAITLGGRLAAHPRRGEQSERRVGMERDVPVRVCHLRGSQHAIVVAGRDRQSRGIGHARQQELICVVRRYLPMGRWIERGIVQRIERFEDEAASIRIGVHIAAVTHGGDVVAGRIDWIGAAATKHVSGARAQE